MVITFHENQSKTNQAGLKGSSRNPIRGPHSEDPQEELSLTQLFSLYIGKLSPEANLGQAIWF
jgi:hypothetical protein